MDSELYSSLAPVREPLLLWFRSVRRPLPWREEPTPYHVWISEIMLQQTRIEAVIPYYHRFLSVFPSPAALAEAPDDLLMKQWEGLGYYSRARNLKRAAQMICERFGGELPGTEKELLTLPGIGPYTAGAIASIAFGQPSPAVDGNVLRVIARLSADGRDVMLPETKADITDRLRAIYPTGDDARDLTQGLMELGQRVCIPGASPDCAGCPLGVFCRAHALGLVDRLPLRSPPKARKIQPRTVFLLRSENRVAIARRPATGLLAGLWEFPGIDGDFSLPANWTAEALPSYIHVFTHIEWHVDCLSVVLPTEDASALFGNRELIWVTPDELATAYPIPSAFRPILKQLK